MNPKNKISISKKNLGFATDPNQPNRPEFLINPSTSQNSKSKKIAQRVAQKMIMIQEDKNKEEIVEAFLLKIPFSKTTVQALLPIKFN